MHTQWLLSLSFGHAPNSPMLKTDGDNYIKKRKDFSFGMVSADSAECYKPPEITSTGNTNSVE
jgi:hypothetical protein